MASSVLTQIDVPLIVYYQNLGLRHIKSEALEMMDSNFGAHVETLHEPLNVDRVTHSVLLAQVFGSPEMLGSILEHLDPEDFCRFYVVEPRVLPVAKLYRSLRRKFLFEPTSISGTTIAKTAVTFRCILEAVGWYVASAESKHTEGPIMCVRKKVGPVLWKTEIAQRRVQEDLMPLMKSSQPAVLIRMELGSFTHDVSSISEFGKLVRVRELIDTVHVYEASVPGLWHLGLGSQTSESGFVGYAHDEPSDASLT